jgi:cholesterol oxidase
VNETHYDYIVIGSGFGGSVSALRLAEKGYKVLVIEQGKWYKAEDFPRTNWQLSRWLWAPALHWYGIMKITIFRHVGIISGTGVGGGSLVYANTLPVPKPAFFKTGSWAPLADWQQELEPFYDLALRMLGAAKNPYLAAGDQVLETMAREIGKNEHFKATNVAVYFGESGKTVPDPYFNGDGPERSGCTFCGACMTGCRHNAKNTLDKNYLYLAQKAGAAILAEHRVTDVRTDGAPDGSNGYRVYFKSATGLFPRTQMLRTRGVVFAGGVLGTVKLLLQLKKKSLPRLSDRVGEDIRTNNESLIAVTGVEGKYNMADGVAIGSILHTDDNSHLEVCRYGEGSGAWRLTFLPYVEGSNLPVRLFRIFRETVLNFRTYLKCIFVKDWAQSSVVLLFMQTLDSTVRFSLDGLGRMKSSVSSGEKPSAFIPEAGALARRYEQIVHGKAFAFFLTPLAGIPGTAHILGGAVMGANPEEGVIDRNNQVFGYDNMLVCDGSMISANPGVNPALSITAITERAMSNIPAQS